MKGFFTKKLWEKCPENPFQNDIDSANSSSSTLRIRHVGVRLVNNQLQVFYSSCGDAPESIQLSTIDLSKDWKHWDVSYPPVEILKAKPGWEGGEIAPQPSKTEAAPENVNQLRDPYVFQDKNNKLYLFYAGCGEDTIGIARLIPSAK